ncbi:oxidoreductase, 2OG-Fe(II) oxygenase family protein [Ancylostoma ceylanicum]|uniref:Oxidoreductase, 2OG-Fe(II) oxygenase family protein n=1 Tax=Ancylostoma ceylanicum TaxID=53326 RepID=A0A0D6LWZ7_9BILA|nr:oxidoreductase, 2OG-Fe(II) oxygenase family protein [Ancylostoma ceylanicum]
MSDFEWYHGIAIAALISVLCYMDYEEALDIPEFHGDDLWENGFLKQCLFPVNAPSDLSCFTFRVEFENVKKVYRGEGDESVSRHREANGTNFFHEEGAGIAAVFRKVEKSIPAVDFQTSEQWQIIPFYVVLANSCIEVLSYKPGGHYVPHHDYYDYESEDYWDDTMRNFGNRFATLLLVLKTADQGGETVYPLLQRTITPEAGDVLFWTDLDRLGQGNYNSLHGACPILGGEKIAATLWIRERGQAMMINDEKSRLFDIESLTKPRIRST